MIWLSDMAWPAAKLLVPTMVLATTASYVIVVCIYRLFFHPLAKYPGPLVAKLTDGRAAYYAWRGDIHLDMSICHETYGDFVRYGPNRLLVNTAKGMRDIYGLGANVTKSKAYSVMVHRAHNTLTMFDKKEHSRRRRVMSQGFSDAAIRAYEPAIRTHVDKLCAQLQRNDEDHRQGVCDPIASEKWSSAKNIAQWCNYLAFDIMADVVFGKQYDLIGKPDRRFVVDAIEGSNVRISVLVQMTLGGLDKWLFPEAIRCRNRFVAFVNQILRDAMQETKAARPTSRNVFSILTKAYDPDTGTGFRTAEVGAESTTLIVAGSDTSSTTLASTFFYLSRYPHAYARVVEEVRNSFSSAEEICMGPKLQSCTYLRACIDESMRISPAVGSALWREVQAGGAVVDGQLIPAGCVVGTSIYGIHHNAAYYPDPFTFRPERWLVGEDISTQGSVDLAQAALNPFSIGPRGCIGKGLALAEVMLAMATFIWTLDFKVAEGPIGQIGEGKSGAIRGRHRATEFQLRDHITSAKDGPYLQFCLRQGSASATTGRA